MATADSMLFSWRDVERLPDLERLALALEHLPDGEPVSALEARRGKGRDDYPVRAMWRALAAGVVFGHDSSASLLRELRRNPALLEMCGFDPLGWQRAPARTLERDARGRAVVVEFPGRRRDGIPTEAAFSRFLSSVSRLEEETGAVSAMAASLRRSLMEELPGFGRHLGYDGKALPSHSTGRKGAESGKTSDPDADWGNHETSGVDGRSGKAWTKAKRWFGYGFHLIADVEHEVPVWFDVTPASASEHKVLAAGVEELFAAEPELAERCADFCADRGLDSAALKARLWDVHGVRPVVDTREMWREEKAEPGHDPSIADPAAGAGRPGGQRAAQREGTGVLPLSGGEDGAADGVPRLRGGPGHAEVPLPGGGQRPGLRGAGRVRAGVRVEVRRVRARGARRAEGRGPADVHADAVGRPVVEARLRPALGLGADQLAAGRRLPLRAPLHPRQGEDEDAGGAGGVRDDVAGAGRPPRPDASTGCARWWSRRSPTPASAASPPPRGPFRAVGRRPGDHRARPSANDNHSRSRAAKKRPLDAPPHHLRPPSARFAARARGPATSRTTRASRKDATTQAPPRHAVVTAIRLLMYAWVLLFGQHDLTALPTALRKRRSHTHTLEERKP